MAKSSRLLTRVKLGLLLEMVALCLLGVFVILDWMNHLSLSPDSTTYIVVAINLLKSGHFYYFVSATNFVNNPGLIPYLEQPPGFPLFLVPFLVVFRDPMISTLIAQCACLGLFYVSLYLMAMRLKFSPFLRVVTLLLFTFAGPFRSIHDYYWTETLFIGLSIAAGVLAVGLLSGTGRSKDWVLFLLLLALSSLVRYTGIADLGLVAPLVIQGDTLRASWRLLVHQFTLIGIAVAGGLLILLALLANLLPHAKPGFGPMQRRGVELGSAGLLAGLAGLFLKKRSLQKGDSGLRTSGTFTHSVGAPTWAVLAVLSAVTPPLVWLARNRYFFGAITQANRLFQVFHVDRLWDPIKYIWTDLLAFHGIPPFVVAPLMVALLILPFVRLTWLESAGFRKVGQIALLGAATAHLGLLWFLSLATDIQPISARYFSPVLAFLLLAMLNSLQLIADSIQPRIWKTLLVATPLVFLLLSHDFSLSGLWLSPGRINFPRQRQLWREIDQIAWTRASSFFYSDQDYYAGGYIHQVFSGRPQGILWDSNVVKNPQRIKSLLSAGVRPFLLVTENGTDARIFDGMISSGILPLERISFPDAGYVLYDLGK